MQRDEVDSVQRAYDIQNFFDFPSSTKYQEILKTSNFERVSWNLSGQNKVILDRFPDITGAVCSFVRLTSNETQTIRFIVHGGHQLIMCPSGGWLLKAVEDFVPSFWIPQSPILRTFDSSERILSEEVTSFIGFITSEKTLSVEFRIPKNMYLDLTFWRFSDVEHDFPEQLKQPCSLEMQPIFFWTSQTIYQAPADLYLYLIHGHVYTNRFIWPRKWKICSELDAYGLFVTLSGLELACNKNLYNLLKRQVLFSVIARQFEDGGWYHGEWTDLMESHYRFHNGAILLLEAALEEAPDDSIIRKALERAISFITCQTDKTDLGLWFLHDSLENSEEEMDVLAEETNAPWIPSNILGKSFTNKLILNSHLDATIVLGRYQGLTENNQYLEIIDSAREATRAALKLHPAEQLYHYVYRAIGLTLLPLSEAKSLPLPVRAIKRFTTNYFIPQLHRIKRKFPRFVMPGGLIDRHLSPLHFNIQYHSVNTMDLARFIQCFPDEELTDIMNEAVNFVMDNNILQYWSESKPRHYALVVWIDAMYRVYILNQQQKLLNHLAEAIMFVEDMELGLPPIVLGSDCEISKRENHIPCPSPTNRNLRVVNFSHDGQMKIMVINSSTKRLSLQWEGNKNYNFVWTTSDDQPIQNIRSQLYVPVRGWLWGEEC